MAETPLFTFKAGRCDTNGRKVLPIQTPGYIYLYSEDDLIHLCWRPRSAPAAEPEIDLITIPGDATFTPLVKEAGAEDVRSPTNGRVFALKFSSSGEKQYFWMQSKSQHKDGDASWFSQRDQRLGQIVDLLLSGEDVNVESELEEIRRHARDDPDDGGSGANEDTDMMDLDRQGSGGAGADATGGDPREEGEASREGGADGGRAAAPSSSEHPQDASALVQNFLNSLGGSSSQQQQQRQGQQRIDKPFTTLPDLLTTNTTVSYIDSASPQQLDTLCALLPPDLFLLDQESASSTEATNPSPAAAQAAIEALSTEQKKDILKRVLRSPQLHQSLGSLTVALRDGGLPMIGEALGLKVENGGLIRGGSMPLGGGDAVEAFLNGVKKTVEEEEKEGKGK
ncbi:hypothetical protein LTR37_003790 [Vermiconidia calcicola]|uniref:Uncharacterized protein n=1 Tax=Vermiconidia calcicola TaxID=1690605 RepID=A0ACC3NQG6_9PEZI|nr:hypothetical protein LTR37_003790 [Vermiconidia calcicola]